MPGPVRMLTSFPRRLTWRGKGSPEPFVWPRAGITKDPLKTIINDKRIVWRTSFWSHSKYCLCWAEDVIIPTIPFPRGGSNRS